MNPPLFSNVRLIASDLDGTLLNSRHEPDPDFFDLFPQLMKHGIAFAAASGRQYFNMIKALRPVVADTYFIAENGSYVVYRGEDLMICAMDATLCREMLARARAKAGVYPVLCGRKAAYIENSPADFGGMLGLYYERVERVADLLGVDGDDFLKIALYDPAGVEGNSYPHFRDMEGILQVKISGKVWLDLSDRAANKGNALRVVQEKLSVSGEETMAFGDYLNDLEMLREAGISYAVDNAHPEIRKAARFVTTSNEARGVTTVLRQLLSTR